MHQENDTRSVFSDQVPQLMESHYCHLHNGSGISLDMLRERGYRSLLGKAELEKLGFTPAQRRAPGILIPLWSVDGREAGCQFKPDNPRVDRRGRPVKYESPAGSSNRLDCPPGCREAIANPQLPLWITEGSKKADALASHGACAVSLTGVWGFKGKNRFGAVTLLADWDYIALKGRQVYLAFDSDIVTKEPVRKVLERIGEHLRRKGAKVCIIHLPQLEGQEKTGIDDYLLSHSLQDAERLAGEFRLEEEEERERYVCGFVLPDGTIGEMVVGDDERSFVIASNGSVRKAYQYDTGRFVYLPTRDGLVGEVVHFASSATPYDSQSLLFKQVKGFIHHYLELPADFEDIASLYILLSWVYEFAPSIPYLRVIGDWGTGKTRFLQVVGSICFRPIFASGATTPAPIFRILEQFRGTLVFDEADFNDSSAWGEMVKLLNNGYRPGMPVLRADKENGKWYPRSYQIFGPKLIATRYPFRDELLEPGLQPRLQEILIPLKTMLNGDHFMAEALAGFIHRLQDSLFSRRRESDSGRVLSALIELHNEGRELSIKNITQRVVDMDDESPVISPEKIGWLTKRLGFTKEKGASSRRRVVCWDQQRIERMAKQYGFTLESPLSREKPFAPFEPFESASEKAKGSGGA